jgi:hypothetical protein
VYPSGREGDAPLIGFAPRKGELVINLYPDLDKKLRQLAQASIAEVRRR